MAQILKRDDITLANNLGTYTFIYQGDINGTYMGQFVFKCFLLPSERLAAGRDRRNLLGEFGILATDLEKEIAFALSELKYRVVSAPPFWNPASIMAGDIADIGLIFVALNAAMDAQELHRKQKIEEKEKTLNLASKAAEAILAQRQIEKDQEKEAKTDEEKLEEEFEDET
jgi:hypothetical protein